MIPEFSAKFLLISHIITEFLEDQLKQIEDERYDICEKSYTPLQNIIDEIIGLYLSTLYKLRFLS